MEPIIFGVRYWPFLVSNGPHFTAAHDIHIPKFMNPEREISSAEQSKYDEYIQIITRGPANPETIGEPLWRIQTDRLYGPILK